MLSVSQNLQTALRNIFHTFTNTHPRYPSNMDDPGTQFASHEMLCEADNILQCSEIPSIIHILCTARPSTQRKCIETYFTPTASFTHPLCRTGSSGYSRWSIIQIYAWYKVLSPHIDVTIDSVGKSNLAGWRTSTLSRHGQGLTLISCDSV